MDSDQLIVDHPDGTFVTFEGYTLRQGDVIRKYQELIKLIKSTPNNTELGAKVRIAYEN